MSETRLDRAVRAVLVQPVRAGGVIVTLAIRNELQEAHHEEERTLENVSELYRGKTRAELVDDLDRYARNYNRLERSRDRLKRKLAIAERRLEDPSICRHGLRGCIECENRCESCGDDGKMDHRHGERLCENCIYEHDQGEFGCCDDTAEQADNQTGGDYMRASGEKPATGEEPASRGPSRNCPPKKHNEAGEGALAKHLAPAGRSTAEAK